MSDRSGSAGHPRGRRPAGADTRADIVIAARVAFAESGYASTSLREIARRAGVDAALVHHYFEGKAALFAETMQIKVDPAAVVRRIVDGDPALVGERAVRSFFSIWDSPEQRPMFTALVRSALTHEEAARALREFLVVEVFGRIVLHFRADEGATSSAVLSPEEARRAGLAAAQMMGLAMMRYVIGFPALAQSPAEQLVPPLARTLQQYLVPDAVDEYYSSHGE